MPCGNMRLARHARRAGCATCRRVDAHWAGMGAAEIGLVCVCVCATHAERRQSTARGRPRMRSAAASSDAAVTGSVRAGGGGNRRKRRASRHDALARLFGQRARAKSSASRSLPPMRARFAFPCARVSAPVATRHALYIPRARTRFPTHTHTHTRDLCPTASSHTLHNSSRSPQLLGAST